MPNFHTRHISAGAGIQVRITPKADVAGMTASDPEVWTGCVSQERFCVGAEAEVADMYPACLIGFDWDVEWCITGYDLNWAYNRRCKMAGP